MKLLVRSIAAALACSAAAPLYADPHLRAQVQSEQRDQAIVSVSGRVLAVAQIESAAGELHHLVKVQTGEDGIAVVDFGSNLPPAGVGERIFASGYAARVDQKPVVFARYAGKLDAVGQDGTGAAGGGTAGTRWESDVYGMHRGDLSWTAGGSGFARFYGREADDAWSVHYDDVGDEGLFDR